MLKNIWRGILRVAVRPRYNLGDVCTVGIVVQTLYVSDSTLLKVFFVALAILILVFRQFYEGGSR